MKSQVKRVLMGTGRALRDGWLMLGVTLAFILLLEGAYRGQAAIKHVIRSDPADPRGPEPLNPTDTLSWWPDYNRDHMKEERVRWAPYVYIRNPTFDGKYMSVDSAGHRITPHAGIPGAPQVRVFFMGGSTMFGWFQRDSFTIPAVAARAMQQLVGPQANIEVTNFGVPGHTFTQELIELMLQLRSGARPDVVVFYDGINDVTATVQNGAAGMPQNEWNRVESFELDRALAAEQPEGLTNDLRTLRRSAMALGQRLAFVKRVGEMFPRDASDSLLPPDSSAKLIVRVFTGNARIVQALAREFGFEPLFVWQPVLLATKKPLTPRERWLSDPAFFGKVHREVPALIEPAMKEVVGPRFIDATTLFDADSLDVFADVFGHTYERANPRIVDTMMTRLGPAVLRAAARARNAGR